jgi:steroid 5-alpha reductase family enzyme
MGSPLNYLAVGAGIHPLEWPLVYVLFPVLAFGVVPDEATASLFRTNLVVQLCIFVPIVQLPALITSRMAYVDIGWPAGLTAMGLTALLHGTGWWLRRWIVSTLLLLHGGRMLIGALISFYPYRFAKDLQRYRFARWRWAEQDGMPSTGLPWGVKIQHDTLQQCYANAVLLAMPVLFPASNTNPQLAPAEVCGWAIWVFGWVFENIADWQKLNFVKAVRSQGKAPATPTVHRTSSDADQKQSARLKSEPHKLNTDATLGHAPWDGPEYRLWTLCRHPNYFGEWCCWLGLVIASFPSLLQVSWSALNRSVRQPCFLPPVHVIACIESSPGVHVCGAAVARHD